MKVNSMVTGGNELKLALAALPANLARNVLRTAVRRGANLIAAKARDNFSDAVVALGGERSDTLNPHNLSGALRASIRTTERRGTPTRVVYNVVAGELSGAQRSKFGMNAAYYALWVEAGHINRKMGDALRGGTRYKQHQRQVSTSNTPAHPYMAPAARSEADAVIATVSESVASQLESL
jgi:hypothetical protein